MAVNCILDTDDLDESDDSAKKEISTFSTSNFINILTSYNCYYVN